MTREHELIVRVIYEEDGSKAKVMVGCAEPEPPPFEVFMCAAEYLTHMCCKMSGAGYEKALELVAKGAMTYRRPKEGE